MRVVPQKTDRIVIAGERYCTFIVILLSWISKEDTRSFDDSGLISVVLILE